MRGQASAAWWCIRASSLRAKRSNPACQDSWIASSLALLAMTDRGDLRRAPRQPDRRAVQAGHDHGEEGDPGTADLPGKRRTRAPLDRPDERLRDRPAVALRKPVRNVAPSEAVECRDQEAHVAERAECERQRLLQLDALRVDIAGKARAQIRRQY